MGEVLEVDKECVFSFFCCFSHIFSIKEPLAMMMEVPPVPPVL